MEQIGLLLIPQWLVRASLVKKKQTKKQTKQNKKQRGMYHAKGEEILYVPYRVQQREAGMKSPTQKLLSTASFSVNSLFFFFFLPLDEPSCNTGKDARSRYFFLSALQMINPTINVNTSRV